MSLAKRELLASPATKRLGLLLGLGLLFGFAGPFGTYPALAPPVRYAFWIGLVAAGYAAAIAAGRLVPLDGANAMLRAVGLALASAIPMTFLVAWVLTLVQPGRVVAPGQLPALFVAVGAVQLLIVAMLLRDPLQPSVAFDGPVSAPAYPEALFARLPRRLERDIVALEAEDHYLRVHTRLGSDLVLMRLSDAADVIDPRLGVRVHRGWWVAREAVAGIERDGHRTRLRLVNELSVPVGRTYLAAVRTQLLPGA